MEKQYSICSLLWKCKTNSMEVQVVY
jgi:hypothetical protein